MKRKIFIFALIALLLFVFVSCGSDEPSYIEGVEYEDIYRAYKENAIRAEEKYEGRRYLISAEVKSIEKYGSLLDFDENVELTLYKKVDNTIVVIKAEFKRSQTDALKKINVGSTITFNGKCEGYGYWSECILGS